MPIRVLTLVALLVIARDAIAQDHLVPDTGGPVQLSPYMRKVRRAFMPAFDEGVGLRAIVLRSMLDQYAVGVRTSEAVSEVFALEPTSSIEGSEERGPIRVRRSARPIPSEVAERLGSLWEEMLLGVRHPAEEDGISDGDTYYFSRYVPGRGMLTGHAHSPGAETRPGRLAALAESLRAYAHGEIELEGLKTKLDRAEQP